MLKFLKALRRKQRIALLAAIVILCIVGVGIFLFATHKNVPAVETEAAPALVHIEKVSNVSSANTFSTVGTVEAVSEAQLKTQSGGQVTSVSVKLGDHVFAGQVLATTENSSQSAAVQQAQGALDASEVGAASSHVSVSSAQNGVSTAEANGVSTYKNAYITIDSILHNDIDTLFSKTNDTYTGLFIDGRGQAPVINAERNTIETQLQTWSSHTATVSNDDIDASLDTARSFITEVSNFVDTLYSLASTEDTTGSYTSSQKATNLAFLSADRTKINGILQSIDGAKTGVISAQKGLEQAQLAGSADVSSASAAQIKIAQGSLNAAKANYEKTIVRTPISGVVNSLYIKTGDYVSPGESAAVVANNNGLEVSTAVGQDDVLKLAIGDTVRIEDTATGTITAIAPALDPTTGKVEVKVSVQDGSTLINGATASVTFTEKKENDNAQTTFVIPLTALKMTSEGSVVFNVGSDQKLVAMPVTIGSTVGDSIDIKSGLTADMEIVTDARGLKAGQAVTVDK